MKVIEVMNNYTHELPQSIPIHLNECNYEYLWITKTFIERVNCDAHRGQTLMTSILHELTVYWKLLFEVRWGILQVATAIVNLISMASFNVVGYVPPGLGIVPDDLM